MNREIKFQVIYNNKVIGYERLVMEDGNIFWQWMCLEMNPENSERWISGVYPKNHQYIRRQFTGLHDKNGKGIYEGDIVKIIDISSRKKPFIAEVYFDLNVASFSGKVKDYPVELFLHNPIKKEHFINEMQKYIFEDRIIEVIGNIYETPELLNQ